MFGSYSEAINILIDIQKQHWTNKDEPGAAAIAECILRLQAAWDEEEAAFNKAYNIPVKQ